MTRWAIAERRYGHLRLKHIRRYYRPPLGPDPLPACQHAIIDKASLWELITGKLRGGERRRGRGR